MDEAMTSFTNKAILLSFKFVNRDKSFYLLIIEFYVLVLACFSSFLQTFYPCRTTWSWTPGSTPALEGHIKERRRRKKIEGAGLEAMGGP